MRNAFTGLSVHQQQHWTPEGKKRQEGFMGNLRKTLSVSNFAPSCKLVENQEFSRDFDEKDTHLPGEGELLQTAEQLKRPGKR